MSVQDNWNLIRVSSDCILKQQLKEFIIFIITMFYYEVRLFKNGLFVCRFLRLTIIF
jgi:hypothetical protein